jgi:hypothetical protein
MNTPLKGSMMSTGIVWSMSNMPKDASECVLCSTYQVTAAEFIPLPIMEITLAAKMSRSPRCWRMLRTSIHFSIPGPQNLMG